MANKKKSVNPFGDIKLAMLEVRGLLPTALQDKNGIVGQLFFSVMGFFDFFQSLFKNSESSSASALSPKAAPDKETEAFVLRLEGLYPTYRQHFMRQWQANPGERKRVLADLVEHYLQLSHLHLKAAQDIVDEQLSLNTANVVSDEPTENPVDALEASRPVIVPHYACCQEKAVSQTPETPNNDLVINISPQSPSLRVLELT